MSLITERKKSFAYAIKGIRFLFKTQVNALIHLILFLFVIVFGFVFRITPLEWCAVIIVSMSVFAAEAINTALEQLCDTLHPDHSEAIGAVKDVAAAAVLMCAIGAAVVGIIIFLPYVFRLL